MMTSFDYPAMFAASFFSVFLLGLQSKNVNQSRYVAAIVTSFGISVANFIFIKYAAAGSLVAFFVLATGGCTGIASSIWFYDKVMKRKKSDSEVTIKINVDAEDAERRLVRLANLPTRLSNMAYPNPLANIKVVVAPEVAR